MLVIVPNIQISSPWFSAWKIVRPLSPPTGAGGRRFPTCIWFHYDLPYCHSCRLARFASLRYMIPVEKQLFGDVVSADGWWVHGVIDLYQRADVQIGSCAPARDCITRALSGENTSQWTDRYGEQLCFVVFFIETVDDCPLHQLIRQGNPDHRLFHAAAAYSYTFDLSGGGGGEFSLPLIV